MRVAEAGTGPAILFIHGWPESWYSWRHQLSGLAQAGYRVIAPDMRGYGDSDAPTEANAYSVDILAKDVVGVLDALEIDKATLVGHDWGAMVVWNTALFHPERFNGVIGMSVPYGPRTDRPPLEIWQEAMGDNFFYITYHNEPGGVAEAEYDSDPAAMITALYATPPPTPPEKTQPLWIQSAPPEGLSAASANPKNCQAGLPRKNSTTTSTSLAAQDFVAA